MNTKKIPLLSTFLALLTTTVSPTLLANQTSEQSVFQPTKDVLANIYIDNNQLVIETETETETEAKQAQAHNKTDITKKNIETATKTAKTKENTNQTTTDTDTDITAITTIKDDYITLYPNQLYILNDSDSDGMIEVSALKSVNASLNEFCYSVYNYNLNTQLYENKTALISCKKGNLDKLDAMNEQRNIANAAASSSQY